MDLNFTASMEDNLDEIASGKADWIDSLNKFYGRFSKTLEEAKSLLVKAVCRKIRQS